MALIQCPECGREISDKAPSCPYCGVPINVPPTEKKVKVTFSREKRLSGYAIYGIVKVDGADVGTASNGASFSAMLSTGSHSVTIDTGITGRGETRLTSKNFTLDIPEDAKSVDVEVMLAGSVETFFMSGVSSAVVMGQVRVHR